MPCLNGGSCVDTGIGIKCTCPPLFTGARCEAKCKYTPMFGVLYGEINLLYNFCTCKMSILNYLFSLSKE